ncbi:DUF5659 domain-containing protein [Clostridium sp. UBA1652]|uniref:DUF5659 domain-containing protein n=1 Tax=Clostridium sp. UBA1652 TaxID=1946348 RepID=UPI00257C9BC3|nr:DUF5659 domain-containing protein [Clostridium sp. UBA1652]
MEYVVTSKRLRDYLYCLGFYYRKATDKTLKQEQVYLFKNTDLLQEAIIFYSLHKQKMIKENSYKIS